jgi:hypothetical protein
MKKLNIKSLLFFAFLTTIGYQANAQTTSLKLGANPTIKHPSALLELEATNKGILMPRVALTSTTDVTTIASPANALTVFNTATVADVTPGYYYYNTATSKWVRVSTEAWGLTGNAGTTPATNFLGTTDNQNLVLKAANNSLLTLGSNGKIGFGLSPDAYSPHRLQSNYSVRFGTPLDGSNQHFSLAQAPSASSGSSLQKPFSLIVGNSFLDRSDIFIGGGLWDGTEAAVQNIRFYTASTKDTPIGTERMVLDPNGNLGIGLSAPANTLHVKATADPVRFEGLKAAALSDNILTTDANGVMKKTAATLADFALIVNSIRTETTNYTAVTADETILVNAAGGNVVITLPNATSIKGKKYNVKKIDVTGNTVQVISAGGTVDGNAAATGVSGTLSWQGWVFQSDGTNWYIISRI